MNHHFYRTYLIGLCSLSHRGWVIDNSNPSEFWYRGGCEIIPTFFEASVSSICAKYIAKLKQNETRKIALKKIWRTAYFEPSEEDKKLLQSERSPFVLAGPGMLCIYLAWFGKLIVKFFCKWEKKLTAAPGCQMKSAMTWECKFFDCHSLSLSLSH